MKRALFIALRVAVAVAASALTACTDCAGAGGGGVFDPDQVERAASFIDRVSVMPAGGLVADPRVSSNKQILIEFLWPVQRSSVRLSDFSIEALNRTMPIVSLSYDLPGDTSTTGLCGRIWLDLADSVYDPAITAPLPVTIRWNAAGVRLAPSANGEPPPPVPTEPLALLFVLSVQGPTGLPPRIVRFGFPQEPNPPQPGWGRAVELSDLSALGGTDALDRVGRSFVLGTAIADRIRPHAPLEMELDRPMSVALVDVTPDDTEGVRFRSDNVGLVFPFTRLSSRTAVGMLPDTEYSIAVLSQDLRGFLPLSSGTQDITGHFLMPRYSDALVQQAQAEGLPLHYLYGDVDYTFRTSPVRVGAPLHEAIVGPSTLSEGRLAVAVQWATLATSSSPDRATVEVFSTLSGARVASGSTGFIGWAPRTLSQGGRTREVLEQRITTTPAFPDGSEADYRVLTTIRDASGTLLGDDEVTIRVDRRAPDFSAADVTVTNRTGSDERLDRVCVGVPRDIESFSVQVTDGRSDVFVMEDEDCTVHPADGNRWMCCIDGIRLGYAEGVDEVRPEITIRATDRAGNTSTAVRVSSTPECGQPPAESIYVADGVGQPLVGVRPGTDDADYFFTQWGALFRAHWAGGAWTYSLVFGAPAGEGLGARADLAYGPDGRPTLCVQHGVYAEGWDAELSQGRTEVLRALVADPRRAEDWQRVDVGPSLLFGCLVVMGRGRDAGPSVACAGRAPGSSDPLQWDQSVPLVTFVRDSGARATERVPVRGSGVARDLAIDFDPTSGRLHAIWRQSAQRQGWGLIQYSQRQPGGSWSTPTYPNGAVYLNGVSPEVRVDANGSLWVAWVSHDYNSIILERLDGSSWRFVGMSSVYPRIGRWGGDPANGLAIGQPFDLRPDETGAMWLAHGGGEGRDPEVVVRRYARDGSVTRDVLDTAGGNLFMSLAVGPGGHRRLVWDERRDPDGGRADVHLYDDANGLILHRDPALGPLASCDPHWFRRGSLTHAQASLGFRGAGNILQSPEQIGHDRFALISDLLPSRVLPASLQVLGRSGLEVLGDDPTLLDDVLDGVTLARGRVPLRYQTSVCVPDSTGPQHVDACDFGRSGWGLLTYVTGGHPWAQPERRAATPVAIRAGVVLEASVAATYESMPDDSVCRGPGEMLYRASATEIRCIRCELPEEPAGAGQIFYHPGFDACLVCSGDGETEIPRPITSTTTFRCDTCASASDPALLAGEMSWDIIPASHSCARCAAGSVPRECGSDVDCPDGMPVCGRYPGLGDGARVCMRGAMCTGDSDCPAGSTCTERMCRLPDGAALPRSSDDFSCVPIGCISCWQQAACESHDDCPANHHCMNQGDGTFGSIPISSDRAIYPTPVCLPRPVGHPAIQLAYRTPDLASFEPVRELADDFDRLIRDSALAIDMDTETTRITGVHIRLTGATVTPRPDTDGQGALRVRISIAEGSAVTGANDVLAFEAQLDDDPAVWVDLQPYSFGGELHFAATGTGFEGELDISLPDCDGIWCPLKSFIWDRLVRGIALLLEGAGFFDPEQYVRTRQLSRGDAIFDAFVPMLFEDSVLRAAFVEPYALESTMLFHDSHATSGQPRARGDIVELTRIDGAGLHVWVRDGR